MPNSVLTGGFDDRDLCRAAVVVAVSGRSCAFAGRQRASRLGIRRSTGGTKACGGQRSGSEGSQQLCWVYADAGAGPVSGSRLASGRSPKDAGNCCAWPQAGGDGVRILSSRGWARRPGECQSRWFALRLHFGTNGGLQKRKTVHGATQASAASLYDGAGQGGYGRGSSGRSQVFFIAKAKTEYSRGGDGASAKDVCRRVGPSGEGRHGKGSARETHRRDAGGLGTVCKPR